MSKTQIVFEYGGQIWEVPRAGGKAHVLASGMDLLTMPKFSPDGSMVVFTGTYDSNTDVYVVPSTGGQPLRLTYHPGPDVAVGWTPDGKNVLFRSRRYSYSDPDQLYTVPVTGGFPQKLPLPMAEDGSYSPDGSKPCLATAVGSILEGTKNNRLTHTHLAGRGFQNTATPYPNQMWDKEVIQCG